MSSYLDQYGYLSGFSTGKDLVLASCLSMERHPFLFELGIVVNSFGVHFILINPNYLNIYIDLDFLELLIIIVISSVYAFTKFSWSSH